MAGKHELLLKDMSELKKPITSMRRILGLEPKKRKQATVQIESEFLTIMDQHGLRKSDYVNAGIEIMLRTKGYLK